VSRNSHERQPAGALSWRSAFEQTVSPFLGSPTSTLLAAFDDVAGRWAHLPLKAGAPFPSGICPDGSPVELSIQWRRGDCRQVRFIAQPSDPDASPAADREYARECALHFLDKWSGAAAHELLKRVLFFFPTGRELTPAGNFFLWLGLAAAPDGRHTSKVYINPWAASDEHKGAYIIHKILEEAGIGHTALHWVARVLNETAMMPLIVGLNFGSAGAHSVKVYFGKRAVEVGALTRLLASWPRNTADDDLEGPLNLAVSASQRGEVHLGLEYRSPDAPPALRVNLFCPDWFQSDAAVLSTLRRLLPENSFEEIAAQNRGWRGQRRINFLGLDGSRATLYFKLARMGSRDGQGEDSEAGSLSNKPRTR